MTRMMRHASVRADQWNRRHAPQVAALNTWIETLTDAHLGSPPLIAPHHHARSATVLLLGGQPTAGAVGRDGSGFLSHENDDDVSARLSQELRLAGLDPDMCVPWNASPWPSETSPPSDECLLRGAALLGQVFDLLPRLRVVVAMGGCAQTCLTWYLREHPARLRDAGVETQRTYHLDDLVTGGCDAARLRDREDGVRATLAQVASTLAAPARVSRVA